MIFGLAPNQSKRKSSTWPTSSNATTASTSFPTRASTRSRDGIAAAGIPLVVAAKTRGDRRPTGDRHGGASRTIDLETHRRVVLVRDVDAASSSRTPTDDREALRVDHPQLHRTRRRRAAARIASSGAPRSALHTDLVDRGAANGGPLASKTVYDVHVVIRSALRHATRCRLVDHNVALDAHPPRPTLRSRPSPEIWTSEQLVHFLDATTHLRLHPALHLAATTGMRRGELAGLRWADWQPATHRLSIARSRQSVGGRAVEIPTKTAASRRCIDLDPNTEHILHVWRQRQRCDRLPAAIGDPIFTNIVGEPIHPESITQLFDRQVARLGLPRIRFHDLRHTHASLLVGAGITDQGRLRTARPRPPRLHHGTYQHLLPGIGAAAARDFAALLAAAGR